MIPVAPVERRLAAQFVDLAVLLSAVSAAVWVVLSVLPGELAVLPMLAAVLLITYLHGVPPGSPGRTLGKRMLGLTVVRSDGHRVDRALMTRRWAFLFVLAAVFPPFSTVAVAAWPHLDRSRRQGLHDRVVGTIVVLESTLAAPTIAQPLGGEREPTRLVRVPDVALASWGWRVLAAAIDVAPFVGAYAVERGVVAAYGSGARWIGVLAEYAAIGWVGYNQYRAGVTGQSLGKRLAGLRLVREDDGQPLGGSLAVVRYMMHTIDITPVFVGLLWPIWDPKRQTFADKLIRSLVIRARGNQSPEPAGRGQQPALRT